MCFDLISQLRLRFVIEENVFRDNFLVEIVINDGSCETSDS